MLVLALQTAVEAVAGAVAADVSTIDCFSSAYAALPRPSARHLCTLCTPALPSSFLGRRHAMQCSKATTRSICLPGLLLLAHHVCAACRWPQPGRLGRLSAEAQPRALSIPSGASRVMQCLQ